MGEIRSTVDLIMEKTRDLSLSPEEKETLRGQEWLGKARGWVQKYLDELIRLEDLKREIRNLGASEGMEGVLKEEIIAPVDPGEDQQRRWEALEALWQIPQRAYAEMLIRCQDSLSQAEGKRMGGMLDRLKQRGISGTAVIPNINQDPEWDSFRAATVRECKENLRNIKYN
jgi:hypothetical protein